MKAIAGFTKTTLIGGVLVVMPIYLSILQLLKALAGVAGLVAVSFQSGEPVPANCWRT